MSAVNWSALAIVFDDGFSQNVNQVRNVCDEAHPRWMPHINLCYPFLRPNELPAFVAQLEMRLESIHPFEASFDKIDWFSKGERHTLHFTPQPVDPFRALASTVFSAVPREVVAAQPQPPASFHPHLTLGQFPLPEKANHTSFSRTTSPQELAAYMRTIVKPRIVRVAEIAILVRSESDKSELFHVLRKFRLGFAKVLQPTERVPRPILSRESAASPAAEVVQVLLMPAAEKMATLWLARMPREKLPKKIEGLYHALMPFCSTRIRMNVDNVLKVMVDQKWIEAKTISVVDRNAPPVVKKTKVVARPPRQRRGAPAPIHPPPTKPKPARKKVEAYSLLCDFADAPHPDSRESAFGNPKLMKARLMFFLHRMFLCGRIFKKEAFLKQLEQICTVKLSTEPQKLVETLKYHGHINALDDGTVIYKI